MSRIIRAELLRLGRRRTYIAMVGATLLFAVVTTLTVFSTATSVGPPIGRGTTTEILESHGGGTEAFAVGASFMGFLVFVTFIGLVATEFSGGTFRAMVLRDPNRRRVLAGKLTGALVLVAGAVALAEAFTFLVSRVVAPGQGIATTEWISLSGLGSGLRAYATVLAGITGWAIFGTTLAVVFRSAPLALGVGFAWAGPFENIIVDSWSTGYRLFPGQVLASVIQGGTVELGLTRAVVTALAYTGIAAAVALTVVSRRDVTA